MFTQLNQEREEATTIIKKGGMVLLRFRRIRLLLKTNKKELKKKYLQKNRKLFVAPETATYVVNRNENISVVVAHASEELDKVSRYL